MSTQRAQVQVLVFGHELSPEAMAVIEAKYGPVTVYSSFFHSPRLCDQLYHVQRCFREMAEQGANFRGNVTTLVAPPGMSVAAMLVVSEFAGRTGSLPVVLNLMKQTSADKARVFYAPSPEQPEYDLQSVRNNSGRRARVLSHHQPKAA